MDKHKRNKHLFYALFAVNVHSHNAHQLGICASMEGEKEKVRERDTKIISKTCKDPHYHILFGE